MQGLPNAAYIASDPDSAVAPGQPSDTVRMAPKFNLPEWATGCRLHVRNPERVMKKEGQTNIDVFRVKGSHARATNDWTC